MPGLEPRLFSFNNPMGACARCDGLGAIEFFDVKRIVAHPNLSLASGAIRGWDRRNHFYYSMLQSLAKHYRFDIEQPWEMLDERLQRLILQGSGKEKIPFHYPGEHGRTSVKEHPVEGVVPSTGRRSRETDSLAVREELAKLINLQPCPDCGGARLRREARHVRLADQTLFEISRWPLNKTLDFFRQLKLEGAEGQIAERIVREIGNRLEFLVNVGLDYLALERSAETLSGGEGKRIRLASQIGSGLTGVLYVLDEPSIGLHQRDNARLLETLKRLRDLGNTVIVVEHDEEAIRNADWLIDMGPGAGVHGGHLVAKGTPEEVMRAPESITGQYLTGMRQIAVPERRRRGHDKQILTLVGARGNHLKDINTETLEVLFRGKSIAEVLDMTVDEGAEFFRAVPAIRDKLVTLQRVGLGYIHIGQPATTLSGGEAQRVKLSKELSRRATGRTLYILDEPTTGLHFEDVRKLLEVLQALVDSGNTIVVIEHNLEVIKTADSIIDLGPAGGAAGGRIVAAGTPEQVAEVAESYTGQHLRPYLARTGQRQRKRA